MSFKDKIDMQRLPQHVAVIMDGNGRWAKKRGLARTAGHENGVTAVRETAEAAAELGIKYLTLYAFSAENWKRPRHEVEALMQLLARTIDKEIKTLIDNDIRLMAIGELSRLHPHTLDRLQWAIEKTRHHQRMNLILALSYSAHKEILEATIAIARKVKNNELSPEQITEDLFSQHLYTANIPDPELLIRTSGEFRISNFLLWQLAYSEIYITPTLWPDFRKEDFYQAIVNYQCRERRFGCTSEQIKQKVKI